MFQLLKKAFLVAVVGCVWLCIPRSAQAFSPSVPAPTGLRFKDFAVVEDQGRWHIFAMTVCSVSPQYCTQQASTIYHEVSDDFVHWENAGVVISPRPNTVDSADVWAPSVVKHGDLWYMFYTAVSPSISGRQQQQIAYATSSDLYTWSRIENNIVLNCGQLSWAYWQPDNLNGIGGDCRDPYVIRDEAQQRWVMNVSARTLSGAHMMIIGQAWSDDLLTWHELPALPTTQQYVAESSHTIIHDNTAYLFWTNNCSTGTCIQWASGPTITGPFSSAHSMTGLTGPHFASEALPSTDRIYFFTIYDGLFVNSLAWNNDIPSITPAPFTQFNIHTWLEVERDGIQDTGEPDAPAMELLLYRDDGDGIWNPRFDHVSATLANNSSSITDYTLAGTYWIVPTASSLETNGLYRTFSPSTFATAVPLSSDQLVSINIPLSINGIRWLNTALNTTSVQTLSVTRIEPTATIHYTALQDMRVLASTPSTATVVFSNDNGLTWRTYKNGWAVSDGEASQSGALNDAAQHISTLPTGTGELVWRIYTTEPESIAGFDFSIDEPVASPLLLGPASSAALATLRPTFTMTTPEVNRLVGYIIETSSDASFSSPDTRSTFSGFVSSAWEGCTNGMCVSQDTVSWTPASNFGNNQLFWRVRSIALDGAPIWSAWSPTQDVVLPSALTMSEPIITILSSTSIRVHWTTNHPASSIIFYSDEWDHEHITNETTADHDIVLTDLIPGAPYLLQIESTDIYQQRIAPEYEVHMPLVDTAATSIVIGSGQTTITVSWTTIDPANGIVSYGTTLAFGQSVSASEVAINHSITLTGLTPGTTYYLRVSGTGGTQYASATLTAQTEQAATITELPLVEDPLPILFQRKPRPPIRR